MLLSEALRIGPKDCIAISGGGGKTTLMFRLAGELAAAGHGVVTTMTTRIFASQMARAPAHVVLHETAALLAQLPPLLQDYRHVLVAGAVAVEADKVSGVPPEVIAPILALSGVDVVIIEADGSRRLPFKAPAEHEPVIPPCATIVMPMAGIEVIGQPLAAGTVHRPERIAQLTGSALGDPITPALVAAVLSDPDGGARGTPAAARLVPFLNKVEDDGRLADAREVARLLLERPRVDAVVLGALQSADPVREVWTRIGVVILAAGGARRFGALKQVLPWQGQPMVAHVAMQVLACPDVDRVVVTAGAEAERVKPALAGLPVDVVPVPDWAEGQSRSVQAGLAALRAVPRGPLGAALFVLADQPGISPELLSALIARHRETQAPVVAPRYQGQRGNPVLFDAYTFTEFAGLQGDVGARPILQAHADAIAWVDWPAPEVIQDIDTPGDYQSYA